MAALKIILTFQNPLVLVLLLPLSRAYTQREEVTAGVSGKHLSVSAAGFGASLDLFLSLFSTFYARPDSQLALIR